MITSEPGLQGLSCTWLVLVHALMLLNALPLSMQQYCTLCLLAVAGYFSYLSPIHKECGQQQQAPHGWQPSLRWKESAPNTSYSTLLNRAHA